MSRATTARQVQFELAAIQDSVEVKEVFIQGGDMARDCHTVVSNRPVRFRLQMLTPGETFSRFNIKFGATHFDGTPILVNETTQAVTTKAIRPPEIEDEGTTVVIPLYFYVLFSQTQKKPIKVDFHLEEQGIPVSEVVSSPPLKVVSKPPTTMRSVTPSPLKRRKVEVEINDMDCDHVDANVSDKFNHICSELAQIKAMMVKQEPDTLVGMSRSNKRKFEDDSSEVGLAQSVAALSNDSRNAFLRELLSNHREAFDQLVMQASVIHAMANSGIRNSDHLTLNPFDDDFGM